MVRKIIHIDEEKCNGCGLCAEACHEGAIGMVNGKAKLLRDDYCDGLGDCLPACPMKAITFTEREAAPYDEKAVEAHKASKAAAKAAQQQSAFVCPGMRAKTMERSSAPICSTPAESKLSQWPVQIKLLPVNAPYFDGADILIAADCTAFAYGDFHRKFIDGKITLIGCPKLDSVDYAEKLGAIFSANNIKSVTVARMEVPCCGGIENAVKRAIIDSGKNIPCKVVIISTNGEIL